MRWQLSSAKSSLFSEGEVTEALPVSKGRSQERALSIKVRVRRDGLRMLALSWEVRSLSVDASRCVECAVSGAETQYVLGVVIVVVLTRRIGGAEGAGEKKIIYACIRGGVCCAAYSTEEGRAGLIISGVGVTG